GAAAAGLLRVGGAGGARAGAGLASIADARGGTADHAGRLEGVRGTVVVRAVAAFVGVARSRRGPADVGLLDVGGAGGVGASAGLDPVADARSRATLGAGGLQAVRRAGGTRPGALLGRIAGAGRRAALEGRGLQRVGRTLGARARAELGHVAGAGRGPAHRGGQLELAVGRAAVAVQLVAVVAVLARVDDAVAAARAGNRGVDDPGDAVVQVHHVVVADAALGAVHAGDDLGVAVEEGRILEPIAARRRVVRRGTQRAEEAVDQRALRGRPQQVVVAEVADPARNAVVGLAGRHLRVDRLVAGVGHEDDRELRVGAQRAVAAGHGLASRPRREPVDRHAGAVEAALGAVAAGPRLHVRALRGPVAEDVDVGGERTEPPPARARRADARVGAAGRQVEVGVGDGHAPVDRTSGVRQLVRYVIGRGGEHGLLP